MKKSYIALFCLVASLTQAAPTLPEHLRLHALLTITNLITTEGQSTWFPRIVDNDVYYIQINEPAWARFPLGSVTPSLFVSHIAYTNNPPPYGLEHRTLLPFPGTNSKTYILGTGSSSAFTLSAFNLRTNVSRYDYNGSNRVDILPPWRHPVEYADWVDEDTIIFTSQNFPVVPELDGRLFLADIVANPFSMSSNTTWNLNGYVQTSVLDRGMQVRVGSKYKGYAYYGGTTEDAPAQLFALNLATGQETALGDAATLTNKAVRMVVERDGYLYVEVRELGGGSGDNDIRVYNMTSATVLGSLYTTYDKDRLAEVTGNSPAQPIWGFDLTPDGSRMVFGTRGYAYLIGPPILNFKKVGSDLVFTWPTTIFAYIQSSPSLSPANFTDMVPQPNLIQEGDFFIATIPIGSSGNMFYRLREGP